MILGFANWTEHNYSPNFVVYTGTHDNNTAVGWWLKDTKQDMRANLKQYVDGLKMNMGEDYPIDTVEGLNAPAVWNPGMKQLTVFQGPALVILTMSESGDKDPLEAAKALGEKALPRM